MMTMTRMITITWHHSYDRQFVVAMRVAAVVVVLQYRRYLSHWGIRIAILRIRNDEDDDVVAVADGVVELTNTTCSNNSHAIINNSFVRKTDPSMAVVVLAVVG